MSERLRKRLLPWVHRRPRHRASVLDVAQWARDRWREDDAVVEGWLFPPNGTLDMYARRLPLSGEQPTDAAMTAALRAAVPPNQPFAGPGELRQNEGAGATGARLSRQRPSLTQLETDALRAFTTDHAAYAYGVYRNDPRRPLEQVLARAALSEPVRTYRVEEVRSKRQYHEHLLSLRRGDRKIWTQPLATTLDPQPLRSLPAVIAAGAYDLGGLVGGRLMEMGLVLFEIWTQRGVYLGDLSGVPSKDERELLLPPAASMRVVGHADLLIASEVGTSPLRMHTIQVVDDASLVGTQAWVASVGPDHEQRPPPPAFVRRDR